MGLLIQEKHQKVPVLFCTEVHRRSVNRVPVVRESRNPDARDLFINQMNLLDQAIKLAAEMDEPAEMNYVRKHALEQAKELGVSVRQAATRVFSNASGSYSSNVNLALCPGLFFCPIKLSQWVRVWARDRVWTLRFFPSSFGSSLSRLGFKNTCL